MPFLTVTNAPAATRDPATASAGHRAADEDHMVIPFSFAIVRYTDHQH